MNSAEELKNLVTTWKNNEPEENYRRELDELAARLAAGDPVAIEGATEMFGARVTFGTAGLRAPMRPGPNGLNRVVIAQTTAGLAKFLAERVKKVNRRKVSVIVGFDGRHNSEAFARDTAEILSGAGIQVMLTSEMVPTPIVAFAVRELDADAGVMITASHNPASDNGFKVYLGGVDQGSQIIPPSDNEIERHIQNVAENFSWEQTPRSSELIELVDESIVSAYIASSLDELRLEPPSGSEISVVYSAMHGVGGKPFLAAVEQAGFRRPLVVEEQFDPDPNFPTVSFPNPEEEGVLDMSVELAQKTSADLIIAHDPDADRLAVGVKFPGELAGYRILSGNEIGAILGWRMGESCAISDSAGSFANSIVSSPTLVKIAEHFGLEHEETLTGFKYVSRVSNLKFGFEEALGFLVTPNSVRDKDGISSALAIISLANFLGQKDETLIDYLHNIYSVVGAFSSRQITKSLKPGTSGSDIINAIRESDLKKLGAFPVLRMDDFRNGTDGFPPTDILRFYLENECRVIVRPSGTEPKVKFYVDAHETTITKAEKITEDVESALTEMIQEVWDPE